MLLPAVLLAYSHFSYSSEIVFGQSLNAASAGYNWVMTNVLPQQAGLEVTNVFYRYTVDKNTLDDFVVSIQNENAGGSGYIFRSVDDWSGLPSNSIVKNIPLQNILGASFGDGSIETSGFGEVSNASVVYSFRFDPCFNPQVSSSCEGFVPEIPEVPEVSDPLDDTYVQDELDRKAIMANEEDEEENRKSVKRASEEEAAQTSLEALLGIASVIELENLILQQELINLSLPSSYQVSLPSPEMVDTLVLKESVTLKSGNRRLQFAQDKLHQKLVRSQFEK